MTAIRKLEYSNRRPGELGVHSVDHFNLMVPDLAKAEKFYSSFGLDVKEEDGALSLYAHGNPHRWGAVTEGGRKQLGYVSFGVFEDDLPRFRERLEAQRVQRLDPPAGFASNGLWFRDPDNRLIEIRVAEKCMPDEKAVCADPQTPAGVRGAPYTRNAPRTRPKRLSHILFFTPDVMKQVRFYRDVVGLRLSDHAGDVIAFMHAIHGSDHHAIAFAKSDAPGLHHTSWDVGSINAIGVGAMHMAGCGFTQGWGFGRHVIGSNYFHYVRDPWGSYSEYSADIDYVPVDQDWEAKDHGDEDALSLWGPEPPKEFIMNFEAMQ
jgi:catechol 2,3-dioxygenase-like lactoylglutathione lyase family enzyme